jgi:hypothetical protein
MGYIEYIAWLSSIYGKELVYEAGAKMIDEHGSSSWDSFTDGEFSLLDPYLP